MQRIPLARPTWDDEMRQAAIATLDSGRWVKGPQNQAFGQSFAAHCGALAAIPCQNGSAALWAAMRLADIKQGDEVIVPSLSFLASATCITLVGATPVFADVDEYWCISYEQIVEKITPRTKAVIAVQLFGQPFDERIVDLCKQNNLILIEDAAQAHGGMMGEKMAGSIGDIACFSFFPSKNMAVGGEGGMITTNRPEFAERLNALVNHGRSDRVTAQELGSNLRMSEVSAAIGNVQLQRLDGWVSRRREIANRYLNEMTIQGLPLAKPGHAWHQFCINTSTSLIEHLDSLGIDSRVHYPIPIHKQSIYASEEVLKRTESICENLVAIPVFHEMTDEEVDRVIQAVNSFAN